MYFKKNEAWYVLFVNTNQEEKVKGILEKEIGDKYKFIIPTRELKERKNGKWHYVRRKLFPGYIFIKTSMNIDMYYKLKNAPGIIRLLRSEDEILTVSEEELNILSMFLSNNDINIGISELYRDKDIIRIISGPLLGLEGQIVKFNFRKCRAKVNINFMNEVRVVELGIELVEKI
ncbi:transcriptional antiterminator NusG [Clostridium saccharoperbutylacetonicum]|uniref:Transcription antiterminator n=1 Tax=Clostridium saccharoperbutylacetonicum N1-4(HMT) TaxID=931276 RepID=M1MEJ7_9CLOT|nr:antiterminator LoaP [Clostridium saccharoperbutylacetonicum]AGF56339.1 transcription antiterminator [Clostridium saccharoperbutylacetonicum N1-4(HMT)]NRT62917.1 transcriptional antiterminator NusG [Clostridium saccharoperbutylacetonicum]NSB26274.1 transcriptional antiterminator NusG [Clostridium saccharoperbutylacetonicum]NSB45625.1 transcriptional antiterminator NusG [Clostridium saccharoperbutylacetonicum]